MKLNVKSLMKQRNVRICHLLPAAILLTFACGDMSVGQANPESPRRYKKVEPIRLTGRSHVILSGLWISNSDGHCIEIRDCNDVVIRDCRLGPSKGNGVDIYNSVGITVEDNLIEDVSTGVYAVRSRRISVLKNKVRNVHGPFPRGQMAQFNEVVGAGNRIDYNKCENIFGKSYPEDAINLYKSSGTAKSPIEVVGNWIRGGGPSKSGGGIMTGDNGGSYIVVQDNILVDPGQYGIAIASGTKISIVSNKIYARKQEFTNVGLYVWNQYPTKCADNIVKGNVVNWTNSKGKANPFWNSGNCDNTVWQDNVAEADLDAQILPADLFSAPWAEQIESDAGKTVLGIDCSRFTINGKPVFLLGFSYYGGLGASEEFIQRDLDDFQKRGFNWFRLWATWSAYGEDVSVVDSKGAIRPVYMDRLKRLLSECDKRGMIVDVTLNRREGSTESGGLSNAQSHLRAVKALVGTLKPYRNWYLDLANERDVGDARFVSCEELKRLREVVRKLDPERLVTASFGGHDLSKKDLRDVLVTVGVDFVCPHRPRQAGTAQQTKARTREALGMMKAMRRVRPLHHQEPFRRGYGNWVPDAKDFLTDLQGAIAGGAAGWCFHNGSQRNGPDEQPRRSFDMRKRRLFEQLDAEELRFVNAAGSEIKD